MGFREELEQWAAETAKAQSAELERARLESEAVERERLERLRLMAERRAELSEVFATAADVLGELAAYATTSGSVDSDHTLTFTTKPRTWVSVKFDHQDGYVWVDKVRRDPAARTDKPSRAWSATPCRSRRNVRHDQLGLISSGPSRLPVIILQEKASSWPVSDDNRRPSGSRRPSLPLAATTHRDAQSILPRHG